MSFDMIFKNQNMEKKQNVTWIQIVFLAYIKTEDIYVDVVKDVEARFDGSNFELDHYRKEKMKK